MKFTGERLVTNVYNGTTINHLHRYAIASNLIKGRIVLDIASGEGYGSNLMSTEANLVYGVDIDAEAIKNAKLKYNKNNLQFLEGSTSQIPLQDNSVDVVISFETLEHHDAHEEMMEEVKRVLKPQGVLLISTPDKHFYTDVRNYNNEFHVKELYKDEFVSLVSKFFENYKLYSQSYINGSSVILEDITRDSFEFYTGDYNKLNTTVSSPNFLITICSDHELQNISNSIFDGKHLLENKNLNKKVKLVYDSNSYRLGNFILSPLKYLKRYF